MRNAPSLFLCALLLFPAAVRSQADTVDPSRADGESRARIETLAREVARQHSELDVLGARPSTALTALVTAIGVLGAAAIAGCLRSLAVFLDDETRTRSQHVEREFAIDEYTELKLAMANAMSAKASTPREVQQIRKALLPNKAAIMESADRAPPRSNEWLD